MNALVNIDIRDTEVVWPDKYGKDGKLHQIDRKILPFQVIETINEDITSREARKYGPGHQAKLFDTWKGVEGETFESGWKNKLIWGENKYIISSLAEKFSSKIKLIYIDPPFDTGADFSFTTQVGEERQLKPPSLIEEKAYRDAWGQGSSSYLHMMYDRLVLMKDLLTPDGSIFVHLDWHVGHYVKAIMDEIFGKDNFRNEIIVKRGRKKGLMYQFDKVDRMHVGTDIILWYTKSADTKFKHPVSESEGVSAKWMGFWSNVDRPTMRYELFGYTPPRGQWKWTKERAMKAVENYKKYEKEFSKKMSLEEYWKSTGETLEFIRKREGVKYAEYWVEPREHKLLDNLWTDIEAYNYSTGYPTEKHEQLLTRIITQFSEEGDIVADFFCGSGTTLVVAEKNHRRWIGADLGRFAIHTSRKRLMEIENCRPFEILNLGKYERQVWQGISFSGKDRQTILYEYLSFILKLYGGEPISGFTYIHGRKGKALVHIGSVDAPVTIDDVMSAVNECIAAKQSELHVLGWEWEMGMHDLVEQEAKKLGVKLRSLLIPNEVMDARAIQKGEVRFFDIAYIQAQVLVRKNKVEIELQDFVIPNTELIPEELRNKVHHWSDFIDYWAVDFDFQNDTFLNKWATYRSKPGEKLVLKSAAYEYKKPGKYKVLVKVIDVFGIDTSRLFEMNI